MRWTKGSLEYNLNNRAVLLNRRLAVAVGPRRERIVEELREVRMNLRMLKEKQQ